MPAPESYAWQFEAIGTSWQIDTPARLRRHMRAEVTSLIERFDAAWSRFRGDSLVSGIAAAAGTWELPDEADLLLGLYAELHELTGGAITPLVGRTLSDLGYDADYSLRARSDPAPVPSWDVLCWEPPNLTNAAPVLLDVGAAGKGCLVDLVVGVLQSHRLDRFIVDAGGDLFHIGIDPIRVALEHPNDPTSAIGVAELAPGQALCASATNRRAWGKGLHHVLDGRTGRPTEDVVATWVVAGSCMLADGLATALFCTDPARLVSRFEHEYVRMHADGRAEWSPTFPGEVFA